jgi:sugar lactone lactonase YvrE
LPVCITHNIDPISQTSVRTLLNRLTISVISVAGILFQTGQAQTITTIASGTTIGDGGPAISAAFGGPTATGFDQKGNLYVVDTEDIRIRKIDANGTITTLAGNGVYGFQGDNGPAISARFVLPRGVAVDASGAVYVADYQNSRIRKISADGIITTIAGTANTGFSGDGGPATSARLSFPQNVAIDQAQNLYIVDSGNNRIRKITPDGIIKTVVGNGTAGFAGDGGPAVGAQLNNPSAVAVGTDGSLYIADATNHRIRKVDPAGTITTIGGNGSAQSGGDGGSATSATLYSPQDVAVDASGTVYLTQLDSRVRKITTNGIISAVAGNGTAGFSGDGGPAVNALVGPAAGVDVDATGAIYIADQANYRIRRITADGTINTIAGGYTGDGGPATNAFFRKTLVRSPAELTVDRYGNIYISDRFGNRIRKVTPAGTITTVAGSGVNGYSGDGGNANQAQLRYPRGVGLDRDDNLYVVDQYNTRLRKVDAAGKIATIAGNGSPDFIAVRPSSSSADIYNSTGIAVSQSGTVYVPTQTCILKIMPSGVISVVAGATAATGYSGDGGPATSALLNYPSTVTLDKDENLYIVDSGNNRVRKVNAAGVITTVVGNGSAGYGGEGVQATDAPMNGLYKVVFDSTGTLFISEAGFNRIRQVDRNGIITTVAGTGAAGFQGDGGPAINAFLARPSGLATDPAGNLYIADLDNRRVRKVTYPVRSTLVTNQSTPCSLGSVILTAGPTGPGFSYQFSPGATQIGTTNQAVVSTAGVFSVTVITSILGSPPGVANITLAGPANYTVKAGGWNDPAVWVCGQVTTSMQPVRVLHVVDLPVNYQADAKAVSYENGGSLRFGSGAILRLSSQ